MRISGQGETLGPDINFAVRLVCAGERGRVFFM